MASGDAVQAPCGPLVLGFETQTGQWSYLARAADPGNLLSATTAADVEVEAVGHPWPAAQEWKADSPVVTVADDGWLVSVTRECAEWRCTTEHYILRKEPLIRRRATLTWRGTEPLKVYGIALRVPGVTLGDVPDAVWSLPGNYPFEERRLLDAVPGRASEERGWTWSDTGCAYAYSGRSGVGLLLSYSLELDHARTRVEELEGGISLVTRFDTLGVFQPGDTIEVGTQWVRVVEGDRAALRQAAGRLAERANEGPPTDRPQWLEGAVIEELHPWGRLESWWAGDCGDRMPSLEAQLPYLRDLGITGTWLLPVSNKPPWVYYLPAFRHLDPQVTSAEQLRSFIAAGHGLGLRTLMDLVTYGISPDSPDVASLPERVWCLDENDQRQKAWGGAVLAADLMEPDWNAHMVDLTSYWVREFGADGFRLDCGGSGQAPNWRPRTGRRANATMNVGGIRQNALIREAIRRANPDAVLLPEAGATSYFRSADLLFDYPFYMVCREITREPRTDLWVRRARAWLAAQQLTHSARQQGALVRFLENHDTVAAQDFFGVGPSQALTALCAFVRGTLLLYQEQEIGFAPEVRRWLRLRHDLPELRDGDADYLAVESSNPLVLPILRLTGDRACIVAISFSPYDEACRLTVPGEWARRWPAWQDALTGASIANGETIRIPAYQPVVLVGRKQVQAARPTEHRAASETAPLILSRAEDRLNDRTVRHTLTFAPMAEWFVLTSEGLLHDEFVDRHRGTKQGETITEAVSGLGRCWRPLTQGLWDGPGEAALGVTAADGRAVCVRISDRQALRDARLDHASGTGQRPAIILDTAPGSEPFAVEEHGDAAALLKRLGRHARPEGSPSVEIDPLWVRVANRHYQAAFSRRHGGTLFGLRMPGAEGSPIVGDSEVYTDWGLFDKGLHVATEWDTNPRLTVRRQGETTEITLRGRLRQPSWNGVQTGSVAEPSVAVRLTYVVDASPTIGVTFGATPSTDRPGTSAFLAYRIPFAGVDRWEVRAGDTVARGVPGERAGQRVFQAADVPDLSSVTMSLRTGRQVVQIGLLAGTPHRPQNPFLLDGGPGAMQLFVAMLNGAKVDLGAGAELTTSFTIRVGEAQ